VLKYMDQVTAIVFLWNMKVKPTIIDVAGNLLGGFESRLLRWHSLQNVKHGTSKTVILGRSQMLKRY
jgi:hypothetical protein